MRVLVVDDNPKLSAAIKQALDEHGFAADVAGNGAEGEELAVSTSYDVIILDVMLPDCDGIELCRRLRQRRVSTPILMLTALAATDEKVRGLDAGADDYLSKPFEFEELFARLRALARRNEAGEESSLRCHDLELDLFTRRATRGDTAVDLSHREFMLLRHLMSNQNRVLTRAQIGEKVWDMSFQPESNVIDVYISALRKKLDHGFDTPLIHTVKGAGYRFGVCQEARASKVGG